MTGGWTDSDLTDLGHRQASSLASRLQRELADFPWGIRLYCSDLRRAVQTAEPIGQAIGATLHPIPGLREFNNGIAAGKSQQEASQFARQATEPILDWQPYPGAETWRQFYKRVCHCMDDLAENHEGLDILVTHGGTIVNVVAWWLRLDVEMLSKVSFSAHSASIGVLRTNQWNERTVERLNDTAHLYADGLCEPSSGGLRFAASM